MNKVELLGRLTRDPDIRYSNSEESIAVARFNLAVERRHRKDGQKIYTTDVVAENVEFAESKAAAANNEGGYQAARPEPSSAAGDGFMNIPDGVEDEGLPFN